MDKTLEERCKRYHSLIHEYYCFNKYYLEEPAKDALLNAVDCMRMIAGERTYSNDRFSSCNSHLPIIVSLANNSGFTEQTRDAFRTAFDALIEVFMHRNKPSSLSIEMNSYDQDINMRWSCVPYSRDEIFKERIK